MKLAPTSAQDVNDFENGRLLFKFAATSLNSAQTDGVLAGACGQPGMDPAPWHALGRGTPAGRALYNLLCTDVLARRHCNSFSERNRALAGAARPGGGLAGAAGRLGATKAPPAYGSRPRAPRPRVPRFPARPSAAPSGAPPRGRRPASSILAATRSEDARARAAPPPPPVRVLGAAETARLALLMESGGALPAHAASGPLGGWGPRARRRGMQEEALALLEQVRPRRARRPCST